MEVDFPTSREEFRRQTGYEFPHSTDDEVSKYALQAMEDATTDGSGETDGFMAWPKSRSSAQDSLHEDEGSNVSAGSYMEVMKEPQMWGVTSNDGSDRTGAMTVDFPEDRRPFRRKSQDSYQSVGSAMSGYNAGGSAAMSRSRGTGDGSGDDSSTLNSRDASGTSRENLRSSLTSTGSNRLRSSMNSRGSNGRVRRRRASRDKRASMTTINSNQSLRGSMRQNTELRKSLRESLVKQGSGSSLRRSLIERDDSDQQRPRRRSRSKEKQMPRRPSLGQLHDDNVGALPLLGWDKESDSDCSSLHSRSRKGFLSRSTRSSASIAPAPLGDHGMSDSKHGMSVDGSKASLTASQLDQHGQEGGMLCDEFRARGSFNRNLQLATAALGPDEGDDGRNLLSMMMEEEYDAKKPWRKAPAGSVLVKNQNPNGGRPGLPRRASGMTMMSSFTSDIDFGDLMKQPPPQMAAADASKENAQTSEAHPRGMTAAEALAKMGASKEESNVTGDTPPADSITANVISPTVAEDESPAIELRGSISDGDTLRTSKTQESVTSSLGEDDDGSELTELRDAQEALFPVSEGGRPESVVSSEFNLERKEKSPSHQLTSSASDAGETDTSSATALARGSRMDLSTLDIVQEEQTNYHEDQQQPLLPVVENGGERPIEERREALDLPELDDLPSSARNDPFKRSIRMSKADDDSVSYSDIDGEQNLDIPSIRMCMTVRDTAIEREFATEQLTDVEFGETTPGEEMTFDRMLLDGNTNDVENPLNDSLRSNDAKTINPNGGGVSKFASKKAMYLRKNVKQQTSKLDTKATRKLRRKNKRLYKFCVWNCRKIAICLLFSLALLIGIAILAWWGATKVTERGNVVSNDSGDVQVQAIPGYQESSLAPTGPDGELQWPPIKDTGRIPPPTLNVAMPSQFPSSSPSSLRETRATTSPSQTDTSVPSNQATQSTIIETMLPSISPSVGASHQPSSEPTGPTSERIPTPSYTPSESPSSNTNTEAPLGANSTFNVTNSSFVDDSLANSPSSNPSVAQNLSSNPTLPVNASSIYESFQLISGAKESEYAGSSVSMTPTGEFVAVGFKEADGLVERSGLVRVYQRGADSVYYPLGSDRMFGSARGDEFGASVSISDDGQRVAVGARSSSTGGLNKNGEVKIFYLDASNAWAQLGNSIQGSGNRDRLGFAVSISGDGQRVAIGAPRGNGGMGTVSLYEYNAVDWIMFEDVVVGDDEDGRTGFTVSLSNDGTTLAVGAFRAVDNNLAKSGSVSVYLVEDESASLINLGQSIFGAHNGAQFGYSVALSGGGDRLVVGSNSYDTDNVSTSNAGHCEVFELQEQTWISIMAVAGDIDDSQAGMHVSMSQDGNVASCSKKGAVMVLEENGSQWDVIDTITSSHGSSESSFGASVSLSQDGKLAVVGAPSYNSSAGFFELFT